MAANETNVPLSTKQKRRAEARLPLAAAAPTLKHVALAAGVSRTTVSNAFNRPGQLSQELREAVLRTSQQLGYHGPHQMARRLRRRELQEVGVVFHHGLAFAMSDPSSVEFLHGVASELDARRLSLQLIPKMGRRVSLDAAFQATADALIVHAEIDADLTQQVRTTYKPLVLVDSYVSGCASVSADDRRGAELAMAHVLAAQPDQVLVLGFPLNDSARNVAMTRVNPRRLGHVAAERMAGYLAAARTQGFAGERIVWIEVDDQWPESAAERVAEARARLSAGARIAVLAMSDRMALAAQTMLRKWRSPRVVSIVGFDDIPAATAAGLTTIRQNSYLKGQLAVQILLDGHKSRVLPVELIVRAT